MSHTELDIQCIYMFHNNQTLHQGYFLVIKTQLSLHECFTLCLKNMPSLASHHLPRLQYFFCLSVFMVEVRNLYYSLYHVKLLSS